MEQTTRTLAVLAVAVLVLAPVVNGVLEEAAATADRIFLKEADWEREPPEDPPEGEPPEDLDRSDVDGNLTGPGGRPTCQIEERWGPRWTHEPVAANPSAAMQNRSSDPTRRVFEIAEDDVAFGVLLNVTDLRGSFSASIYPEGQEGNPEFSFQKMGAFEEDVQNTSTTRRPTLTTGTWVAELNYPGAQYDSMRFWIRIASCAGASQ